MPFSGVWGKIKQKGLGIVQIAPLPVRLWPGKIREIEVFVLREGRYRLLGECSEGETARSELLEGFEVAVREKFASGR